MNSNVIPISAETAVMGWKADVRARLRRGFGLTADEADELMILMLEAGGLQAACDKLGLSMGQVLMERRKNAKFRRGLEEVERQRRAMVEMLLMDMVVCGLCPKDADAVSDAREKFLASLAQSLVDKGQKAASSKVTSKVDTVRKTAKSDAKSVNAVSPTVDELERLIRQTEGRILAAEMKRL